MDIAVIAQNIGTVIATVGLQILGAIVLLIVGRWLIGVVVRLLERSLERQKVDPTVLRYVGSAITVALNIVLVVAILGYFGLETTSFAALLAATGVAIGMAWSGLLANFAAGVFLLILRPFKVEDFIQAGGVMGTVKDIGSSSQPSILWIMCERSSATTRSFRTTSRTLPRILTDALI